MLSDVKLTSLNFVTTEVFADGPRVSHLLPAPPMDRLRHRPYLITGLARNLRRTPFPTQLKKLYYDISHLESKVLASLGEPQDESRIVIRGCPSTGSEEAEKA